MILQLKVILTGVDEEEYNGDTDVDGNEVHESHDELIAPHLHKGHPLVQYDSGNEKDNGKDATNEHHLQIKRKAFIILLQIGPWVYINWDNQLSEWDAAVHMYLVTQAMND